MIDLAKTSRSGRYSMRIGRGGKGHNRSYVCFLSSKLDTWNLRTRNPEGDNGRSLSGWLTLTTLSLSLCTIERTTYTWGTSQNILARG